MGIDIEGSDKFCLLTSTEEFRGSIEVHKTDYGFYSSNRFPRYLSYWFHSKEVLMTVVPKHLRRFRRCFQYPESIHWGLFLKKEMIFFASCIMCSTNTLLLPVLNVKSAQRYGQPHEAVEHDGNLLQ